MGLEPAPIQVLGLTGPPAVGKSEVVRALARRPGVVTFRLRDQVDPGQLAATVTRAQAEGWIDDRAVTAAVTGFFDSIGANPALAAVLCDNFPGSGRQVGLLASAARSIWGCRVSVKVVQLHARGVTLVERASQRLVCAACEKDLLDDPRLPAAEAAPGTRSCAACAGVLRPRANDAPPVLARRVNRSSCNLPAIRLACASEGVPFLDVDADRPLGSVVAAINAALAPRPPIGENQ